MICDFTAIDTETTGLNPKLDRIIEIGAVKVRDGKITEDGTHDELMALGGKYKEFFDVQSKYYKDGGKENEEEN